MNANCPTDDFSQPAGRWPVLLCLSVAAVVGVAWRVLLAWQGADLFSDDAYYYTIIARNFVETGRFTFDGFSDTNGFHPLLFWLQAAGFAVFGTGASPMTQYLVLFCVLAGIFLATAGACLLATGRKAQSEEGAVLRGALLLTLCVVLVPRYMSPYLCGMEAVLVLPLLLLFAWLAYTARYALAGTAAMLLVMARLDALPYVVLPVGLGCVLRERRRVGAAIRTGLLVVLPAVAATALLMLWYWWHFGDPMPIHGVLKSCFPKVHFQWQQLFGGVCFSTTLPFALLAAAVGVALLLQRPSPRLSRAESGYRTAGFTAAALCLIQLAAFVLFQKWSKPVPTWYLGPAVLTGTFALCVGLAHALGLRRLKILTLIAAVLALVANLRPPVLAWYRDRLPLTARGAAELALATRPVDLIEFIKSQPADRIWACTDCGKIAFFSGRSVVNLDGLVNDFHYQDVLRDKALGRYLRERKVRYLVFLAWSRPQVASGVYEPMYECRAAPDVFRGKTTNQADYQAAEFYVYSYKYMTYSDRIRLPRAAEVWRSAATPDGRAMGRAVVFDLELLGGPSVTAP